MYGALARARRFHWQRDPLADRSRDRLSAGQFSTGQTVHIADVAGRCRNTPFTKPHGLAALRTMLGVPMLREGRRSASIVITAGGPAVHREADRTSSPPSPPRPSSPSRTPGCSTSCAMLAAADRHRRCAQGHQPLDLRSADGATDTWSIGRPALRGGHGGDRSPKATTYQNVATYGYSTRPRRIHRNSSDRDWARHDHRASCA